MREAALRARGWDSFCTWSLLSITDLWFLAGGSAFVPPATVFSTMGHLASVARRLSELAWYADDTRFGGADSITIAENLLAGPWPTQQVVAAGVTRRVFFATDLTPTGHGQVARPMGRR